MSSGAARVTKDVPRLMASLANSIRAQEAVAKSARLGMWRYGDIEEDDDFEFGTRRRDAQQAPILSTPTPPYLPPSPPPPPPQPPPTPPLYTPPLHPPL